MNNKQLAKGIDQLMDEGVASYLSINPVTEDYCTLVHSFEVINIVWNTNIALFVSMNLQLYKACWIVK
jgi:hypothetical protein